MTKNYRNIGYSCHKEVNGVFEQIMKEACNEVYVSIIIEKGNESDVDTCVWLMAPDRIEDLYH